VNAPNSTHQPSDEDGRLVDLVAAALVDPNIHTDMRMRLHNEMNELLEAAHRDLHRSTGREVPQTTLAARHSKLPEMLEAVLVDPNLHTDLRMRLHREISELLRAGR
jgi:hypothetical protein